MAGRLGAALLIWGALSAPAQALFGDDEARKAILELRAKVAEMENRLREKDAELATRIERLEAANRAQLEFANTVDAQRKEIATLRGQVETLTNEVATLQKRNRDLYADLDGRLKSFEPIATTVDGKPATVDRAEQAAYDAALAQFRAGDFRGAAAGLQAFLAKWPKSAHAPAASYWLGNSLYGLKDYRGAIAAQQAVVDRYPDSPRAPDALLNIAASQVELKDTARARAALQKILADYPNTEAAKVADERLKALGRK
ncbi:MAG: ybgF [Burkholderiaceae bacterium]|nr:ybgF [Burkholderiaceae bacterium]